MSGYSLQEILGRKTGSLFRGPNTDHAAEERMRKAVAGGRNCREEIVNYHKDGHPYAVRLMMNPLYGPDGVVRGFLAVEQMVRQKSFARRIRLQFAGVQHFEEWFDFRWPFPLRDIS